jgi:PST family polysaccharide transporter
MFPAFARIAADEERFRGAFTRSLRVAALVVFPVSFVFLVLGEPIAVLVFGDVWRQAGHILMALSGITAAAALISVAAEAVKAAGRPDILPRIHALAGLLSIVLIIAFLPLGAVGVGVALSVGSASAAVYGLARAAAVARVPLRQMWGELVPAAVASAIVAALFAVLNLGIDVGATPEGVRVAVLLSELLFGAALYAVVVGRLSPKSAAEVAAIRRLLAPRLWRSARTDIRSGQTPES